MPAPQPIQIRYGNAGLLGAAAAAAGSGQAWNQQHAMDMQLIMQQLQGKQQASLLDNQQSFQANQLQQAGGYNNAPPAPANYYSMADVNAAGDPGHDMKQMSLSTAQAAGVQGPELAILQGAANDKHINAAYFETMADEMKKRAKDTSDKQKLVSEKNAYVSSLGNSLPPEEMDKIKSLASAEDMNLPQLRAAVDTAHGQIASQAKEADTMHKTIVQMGIGAFNDKINQSQSELKAMEKDMQDAREKAVAGRTRDYQMNQGMTYDEALASATSATPAGTSEQDYQPQTSETPVGFWGNAVNTVAGAPIVTPSTKTTPGDPMGLRNFLAIKQKRQEIAAMQKQRDDLIATVGGPVAPGQKPITPDIAKQFVQQAGGDNNKARQLAAQAGYAF